MRIPICNACGQEHYNFQTCTGAADKKLVDAEEQRRETNRLTPVFRPRPPVHVRDDGFVTVIGDKGPTMVFRKRG